MANENQNIIGAGQESARRAPKINTIYCENCIETMSRMPDGFVDLVVTSPPYDSLRIYNGKYVSFNFKDCAKQLFRIMKVGGIIVWVVGDETINGSESGTSFYQALYFKEIGLNLHDTMIYDKGFTPCYDPRNKRYKHRFEYMFILSKGKPKTYNEIKDVPVLNAGIKKGSTARKPNGDMRLFGDIEMGNWQARGNIWTIDCGFMRSTPDKNAYKHPAIFPERLASDHIVSWSNVGELVYDPFLGSGTTAKMSLLNGRNFIGSEISEEYCRIAEDRIHALRSNVVRKTVFSGDC